MYSFWPAGVASPTAGIDPDELIDVRPFAKGLHHYILNHRDLYGLPRRAVRDRAAELLEQFSLVEAAACGLPCVATSSPVS